MGFSNGITKPRDIPSLAMIEPAPFDPWDEALMHDLCGKRLGPVIADLLIALDQIKMTRDSFGADAEKTVQFLVPKIQKVKDACLEEYKEAL